MTLKNSTGIVLSSAIMGEADIRATILCRDEGKKTFVLKGLKKSLKRPQSASEPGTVTKLIYNDNRNKELITAREFSVLKYFHGIRADFNKIAVSALLLELTEKTTGFNHKENKLFELLAAGLTALETTKQPLHLAVFFIIHMIRLHGILPQTQRCSSCGAAEFTHFMLDEHELKLTCSNCVRKKEKLLSQNALDFLSAARAVKFSELELRSICCDEDMRALLFCLSRFLENYFSIKLHSNNLLLNTIENMASQTESSFTGQKAQTETGLISV